MTLSALFHQYFKLSEFDQFGLPGSSEFMCHRLLNHVALVRKACDFKFIIESAFRSKQYNLKVSSTGDDGPHTKGVAIDIRALLPWQKYLIVKYALTLGEKNLITGIGIGNTFVHLDACTEAHDEKFKTLRPWVWTYGPAKGAIVKQAVAERHGFTRENLSGKQAFVFLKDIMSVNLKYQIKIMQRGDHAERYIDYKLEPDFEGLLSADNRF